MEIPQSKKRRAHQEGAWRQRRPRRRYRPLRRRKPRTRRKTTQPRSARRRRQPQEPEASAAVVDIEPCNARASTRTKTLN
ncbi:hypothetical protein JG688_00007600 [Phytophthora aleatoria]|uniref:Uncharacterized protein n=1 Tax=Phytophthora aleatoria TaxID=2496075 RepID=A0A8J5IVA2_9STRA|nr:hypothetical protein JG688_00007600 [Phytophthora aleatoria]